MAVWVSALSRDVIVTAYAEAAARVLVEQDPRIADRPPEQAAGRFREWLADVSRRWLRAGSPDRARNSGLPAGNYGDQGRLGNGE
ncbi:hypothetical protein [Saccharothrix sp. NRRL B-16348]|uniref:hypothetical protein n=1 Tax=Saccharothrix sp. NRRL B-16348 TaxID=1415542 RepID=UPI0012F97CCD|nr:hypothetical protein [Saccharothrix sp. NRRL B-16348]